MKTILITTLSLLALFQLVLMVSFTRRLLVEFITEVDMWLHGLSWEFDWNYVIHGK